MSVDPSEEKKDEGKALVSVTATDLFGVGKGLDTLIRALRDGIGPAFEPWARSRLAKKDQRAAGGWVEVARNAGLEAQVLEVTTLAGRSDIRLIAEKERHQDNREAVAAAVVQEARLLLDERVTPKENVEIEPEWLNRYWRLAQDISSEDLQSLWARVLTRQAIGVGHLSTRSLDVLSTLSREEAAELTRIAAFSVTLTDQLPVTMLLQHFSSPVAHPRVRRRLAGIKLIIRQLIRFDRLHFASFGLTFGEKFQWTRYGAPEADMFVRIAGKPFRLAITGELDWPTCDVFPFDGTRFTATGTEIMALIKTEPNPEFLRECGEAFALMGLRLEPV